MGYLPPVRDDQTIVYGNRMIQQKNGIRPSAPVVKGKFHGVLSEREKQAFLKRERKEKNKQKKMFDRDITGKGTFIDEVV